TATASCWRTAARSRDCGPVSIKNGCRSCHCRCTSKMVGPRSNWAWAKDASTTTSVRSSPSAMPISKPAGRWHAPRAASKSPGHLAGAVVGSPVDSVPHFDRTAVLVIHELKRTGADHAVKDPAEVVVEQRGIDRKPLHPIRIGQLGVLDAVEDSHPRVR